MMNQEKEEMLKTIENKKSSFTEHLANKLRAAIKKKNYVKLQKINIMFPDKDKKDKVITKEKGEKLKQAINNSKLMDIVCEKYPDVKDYETLLKLRKKVKEEQNNRFANMLKELLDL